MTTAERASVCGILLLDKPEAMTSAQVVAEVKRSLGGEKVGHLGTLDPFASGLLPLCVGEGTKLAPYVNEADKRYRGVIRLGLATDTLDRTGQTVAEAPVPELTDDALGRTVRGLLGEIDQVPPMFSAIKKDGVRMYRLARAGIVQELEARRVTIHDLRLARIDGERLAIEVHCSKGTYVRSLARDIGAALGTLGVLERLVRTAFGDFGVDQAVSLEAVKAEGRAVLRPPAWVPGAEALGHLTTLAADHAAVRALRAGQQRILATFPPPPVAASGDATARVLDGERHLVAVLRSAGGRWRIDRVFT
jgi:tRNA pseudouridine55 synthase